MNDNVIGVDCYNIDSSKDAFKTITSGRNDTHNIPVVCFGISIVKREDDVGNEPIALMKSAESK